MEKNEFSKKTLSLIAVFLMLSIALPLTALPAATAHTPAWDIVSYPYISAAPSPVGVGQEVYVFCWIDLPFAGAGVNNNVRRHDYKLVITDPDGQNSTKTWDVIDDTTGIQAYTFTPDKVGNYTLSFYYPGEYYVWNSTNTPNLGPSYNPTAYDANWNDWYQAASASRTLEVTEEQVPAATGGASLPTEYWARPINGQNNNWYTIASNWLNQPQIRSGATATGGAGYGRYQPDGIGPEAPHVLWTKPIQFGGVTGSATMNDGEGWYTGSSYNPRFANAIVMQGTLFYQEPYGNSGGGGDYVSVNLLTGEENWRINVTETGAPTMGYMYGFEDGNQHGVLPNGLLIASKAVTGQGTVWRGYDAATGRLTDFYLTNVPSGTAASATLASNYAVGASALGPRGEYLSYGIVNKGTTSNPNWYLNLWNMSRMQNYNPGGIGASNWFQGAGSTVNATDERFYAENASIPLKGTGWKICRDVAAEDRLLLIQGNAKNSGMGSGPRDIAQDSNLTLVSIAHEDFGRVIWSKNYAPPVGNITRHIIAIDYENDVFITEDKETLNFDGWDLTNGNHIWTAEPLVCEWDTLRRDTLYAYGHLYAAGYDGIVYAYNVKTGNLDWTYGNGGAGNTTSSGSDTVYGHYPTFIDVIADGKVYTGTTEHSPDQPLYKGGVFRCLNATTGEEIWQYEGMGSGMYVGQNDLVADGVFVALNIYDMQIYAIGKGASRTTIDVPAASLTEGQSVVIRGTVTDLSAGTQQEEQAARFPDGLPCVSDASQKEWMEYVYQQQNKPTDTTGVDVAITVVDANGNYRYVGMTTSDASGFYSYQWTPDITGKYTVIATFGGSNSYYGSSATSAFAVDAAPATPTPVPTAEPTAADLYFLPAVIGIILAIIIGFAVIIVLLMKKP